MHRHRTASQDRQKPPSPGGGVLSVGLVILMLSVSTGRGASCGDVLASRAPLSAIVTPGLTIDVAAHEVRLEATVCLGRGILEYLLCRPGTFEHESLFTSICTPSHLHMALLVIGCDALPCMGDDAWAATVLEHPSAQLRIEVAYEVQGIPTRHPLSAFLVNRERTDGLVSDRWVFGGSLFVHQAGAEFYAADRTGAVIGLTPRGAAVIQYGQLLGNAYQGDDQGLAIAEQAECPHLTPGTAVHLIITPASPPTAPEPAVVEPAATSSTSMPVSGPGGP